MDNYGESVDSFTKSVDNLIITVDNYKKTVSNSVNNSLVLHLRRTTNQQTTREENMTTQILKNLEAQVSTPTTIIEFFYYARRDLSGTDYPGALQLVTALCHVLTNEGYSMREARLFSANCVIALEGTTSEVVTNANWHILDTLENIDLKAHGILETN